MTTPCLTMADGKRIFQFEKARATVQHMPFVPGEPSGTPDQGPFIEVMVLDDYGYQREMLLGKARISGTHEYKWVARAYVHGLGPAKEIILTEYACTKLMTRFMDLVENYPTTLFNDRDEGTNVERARCKGFVQFHNRIHAGFEPVANDL